MLEKARIKNRFFLILVSTLLAVFGLTLNLYQARAAAGINQTIPLQGKVVNSDGTNVTDGVYSFVLKLYDGAGSAATNSFTESWTTAALWSSTMSSAPGSAGESLTYSSDTNESTIKVGQILTNTTKVESVVVAAVNTGTNVITISPTRQAWATGDTVTNKLYVKDGIFHVNLNSLNNDLSAVDFNTDNIFLGINFNADGEMKPRIQYGAAPYAMNAQKVAGLTVSNTTGTLTIANGKTLTANNTLTFAGTDSTTITFQGTDTYVGRTTTDTLTNKTLTAPTIQGTVGAGTGLTLPAFTAGGAIIPASDDGVDLGSASLRFRDLYLGPSSLKMYNSYTDASNYELGKLSFATNIMTIGTSAAGTGTVRALKVTTGTNTGLNINSSGQVGLNTASPGSTLDVKGTLRVSGATSGYVGFAPAAEAGSTTYTLPVADGSTGQVLATNGTGTLSWATASGSSQWTTSGSDIYYTTGSVGINDTTPDALFDIDSAATTGTGAGILMTALTTGKGLSVANTSIAATSADLINGSHVATYTATNTVSGNLLDLSRSLTVNGTDQTLTMSGAVASIQDSCTVTVGACTSTADVLQLVQNYTANSGAALNVSTAGTGLALRINDDGTLTDATPVVVDSSGNVGLGTATPGASLDILPATAAAFRLQPFGSSAGNTAEFRLAELAANGANFVGFKAPDAITANVIWKLPNADGAANQVLKTDGSGALGWAYADPPPVGAVLPYGGSSAPSGYLLANGAAVSRATYADLFTVYGTTYGAGDGSTTFNLPDLRGRNALGVNGTYTLGQTGGEATHVLTVAELAPHTHTGAESSSFTSTPGIMGGSDWNLTTNPAAATGSTGSGTAHNVLDPYLAVNYIVKYSAGPVYTAIAGSTVDQSVANGRLTLTAGTPVTTSDVTGANAQTIYYSPYNGSHIALYDGANWALYTFSELSKALGTLTGNKNYDVFVYANGGTPTIDTFVAWTNNTTRATNITRQDGVWVKNGDATRRYLGTFRTVNTTQTEDSLTKRFVWNINNQVTRRLFKDDYTTHSYNGASERAWNANTNLQVQIVVGNDHFVKTAINGFVRSALETATSYISLGLDNTVSDLSLSFYVANYNPTWVAGSSTGGKTFTAGYHYVQAVENGSGSPASEFASVQVVASVEG